MPPKKVKKPEDGQTEEELQREKEAQRLRSRAESHLLQKKPPTVESPGLSHVPRTLRKSDGADIVKRNANRKKKYLLLFPGAASLPPGAKVGELAGLDTRTPVLYVDFPPHGRIKLCGSLVFPKNSFIAVKGPSSAKKPVQVVDAFETLVVFAEWAWIGDETSNPGQVPQPLPATLRRAGLDVPELWLASKGRTDLGGARVKGAGSEAVLNREEEIVLDSESSADVIDDSGEGKEDISGDNDDSDDWRGKASKISVAPRAASARKRRQVNYAQMLDESSGMEDVAGDGSDADVIEGFSEARSKRSAGTEMKEEDAAAFAAEPSRKRKRAASPPLVDSGIIVDDVTANGVISQTVDAMPPEPEDEIQPTVHPRRKPGQIIFFQDDDEDDYDVNSEDNYEVGSDDGNDRAYDVADNLVDSDGG